MNRAEATTIYLKEKSPAFTSYMLALGAENDNELVFYLDRDNVNSKIISYAALIEKLELKTAVLMYKGTFSPDVDGAVHSNDNAFSYFILFDYEDWRRFSSSWQELKTQKEVLNDPEFMLTVDAVSRITAGVTWCSARNIPSWVYRDESGSALPISIIRNNIINFYGIGG